MGVIFLDHLPSTHESDYDLTWHCLFPEIGYRELTSASSRNFVNELIIYCYKHITNGAIPKHHRCSSDV
jgi:hypothetical protein